MKSNTELARELARKAAEYREDGFFDIAAVMAAEALVWATLAVAERGV